MPEITTVAGNKVVNKTKSVLALMELIFYRGRDNLIEKSVIQASIQDGRNHIKITIKLRTIIQNCLKSS